MEKHFDINALSIYESINSPYVYAWMERRKSICIMREIKCHHQCQYFRLRKWERWQLLSFYNHSEQPKPFISSEALLNKISLSVDNEGRELLTFMAVIKLPHNWAEVVRKCSCEKVNRIRKTGHKIFRTRCFPSWFYVSYQLYPELKLLQSTTELNGFLVTKGIAMPLRILNHS